MVYVMVIRILEIGFISPPAFNSLW